VSSTTAALSALLLLLAAVFAAALTVELACSNCEQLVHHCSCIVNSTSCDLYDGHFINCFQHPLAAAAAAEARGGLHVVEQSLWAAVPSFLRRLSAALKKHTGRELPLNATPIRFGSWMGGDRDGNPNVTAKTTHHVVALSRCAREQGPAHAAGDVLLNVSGPTY
jgi:hypothetical protein